jgi:hypothetical protein
MLAAVLVTITNQSGGDLPINPADFVARDAQRRIYPANRGPNGRRCPSGEPTAEEAWQPAIANDHPTE